MSTTASDPMQLSINSAKSNTQRSQGLAYTLKRSFDVLQEKDKTDMPLEEFTLRVKRQRLAIYEGMLDRDPEAKAGLILQLGSWLCQQHGFGLTHPITKAVQHVSCPVTAFPFDIITNPWEQALYGQPDFIAGNGKDMTICDTTAESVILSTAIGRQQRATFVGFVRAAALLVTVVDTTMALQCRYCEKRCSDPNVFLLTVAEEYAPTCKHPKISDDDVVWASDDRFGHHDLYGSRSMPGKEHEREGSAICLGCLYEHVMMHDPFLCEDLSTWYAFEIAAMKNLLTPKDAAVRRICACEHPTIQGAMCLFRFSHVIPGASNMPIYSLTTLTNVPLMITQMMNTTNAATLENGEPVYQFDECDLLTHKMVIDSVRFGSRFSDPRSVITPATADSLESVINARFNESNGHMKRLESYLTNNNSHANVAPLQAAAPSQTVTTWKAPTADEQQAMSLSEHYAFMERSLPIVEAYYHSANQVMNAYSDRLFVSHDTPERMPPYCHACGNYGHPQIKTCPFATNKKITPRNNTSRAVHFADNVKSFVDSNRDALTGITSKNQWEAAALLSHTKDLFTRVNGSKLARRGGPTPAYIGTATSHKEAGRGKRAPIPTLTPSISFETLASIPANLYASALDVGLFTNVDYYTTAMQHWTSSQIACADMADLLQWLLEVTLFCPKDQDFAGFITHNQDKILASLHHFVQRRKRHVVERRLLGDDEALAQGMRAEGTLTGWVLPESPPQRSYTSAELLKMPMGSPAKPKKPAAPAVATPKKPAAKKAKTGDPTNVSDISLSMDFS